MVHIGKIIEQKLREKRYPITDFAKKINTDRSNVYNIFRRNTIDTGLLQKISEILEHDFFQYFISEQTKKDFLTDEANVPLFNNELLQMRHKIESFEIETEALRARLKDKEMIIELLKKTGHNTPN